MRVLVTGSEGNIGKVLAKYLERKGHEVYGVDIKQAYGQNYKVANICNPADLISVFNIFMPDVVYHLAAMVSRITCEKSPAITIETNVSGTNNIVQLCKNFGCKLINFSTSEVYGNIGGVLSEDREDLAPNNIYGLSKLLAEQIVEYEVKNSLLDAITVRPFMFYDENETIGVHRSAMIRFAEGLLKKEKITVHEGAMRSWLHVNDGVKILEKLMHRDGYEIVNIANPNVVPIQYVAKLMCDELNLDYDTYVLETSLPGKMTLEKTPSTKIQETIAPIEFEYPIERGVRLVLNKVKERL